jgi:foldase protein PrsA
LIEQEARKANVSVSEKEIDDEVKKVEAQVQKQQGQKLDDVLTLQGMTRADLRNLIKLDKLVGKIVGREVKVSEKEVNDFIEKNREILPQDQSEDALKKMAEERLKQQKMNEKVSTWLESLQNKAKILYFVQY